MRARYDRGLGHGRRETRSLRVLTVTDLHLDFPYVVQAVKILRHHTDARTGRISRQTVYAITDLTALQASPTSSPARTGPSRTGSISCATPPSPRTHPRSAPATAHNRRLDLLNLS